jgi:LTXXQ motif family protein
MSRAVSSRAISSRLVLAGALAALLAATAMPSVSEARRLHFRIGGPIGVVGAVASLAFHGVHRRHGHRVRTARAEATGSLPRADGRRGNDWVLRPVLRVQAVAGAALAGWHGGRRASGWWQHGDGSYGWVGPLFWPLAYYDIYDYVLWGDGMGFWGYGYRDIYAAIFTPYDDDELARYVSPPRGRAFRRFPSLARVCGDAADDVAGLPIEQIRQTLQLREEQRTAVDDLRNASLEAAQAIRAACPSAAATTPSGRLAEMQRRLEAMKGAIAGIRTPFEEFYESLDDDQKAKLAALNEQRAPVAPRVPAVQSCTPPEALQWPAGELEAKLHLNDAQREAFGTLSRMNELARNTLNFNCQPDDHLAAPDRLATADTRLDAMLDAIKQVRPALDDFLATLTDEQKARFGTIGATRTS